MPLSSHGEYYRCKNVRDSSIVHIIHHWSFARSLLCSSEASINIWRGCSDIKTVKRGMKISLWRNNVARGRNPVTAGDVHFNYSVHLRLSNNEMYCVTIIFDSMLSDYSRFLFFNKDGTQRWKEIMVCFLVFNKSILILFIVLNRTIKYSVVQKMTLSRRLVFFFNFFQLQSSFS